jgi:hypothetical protein
MSALRQKAYAVGHNQDSQSLASVQNVVSNKIYLKMDNAQKIFHCINIPWTFIYYLLPVLLFHSTHFLHLSVSQANTPMPHSKPKNMLCGHMTENSVLMCKTNPEKNTYKFFYLKQSARKMLFTAHCWMRARSLDVFQSEPKKILVHRFVAILVFKEMYMRSFSRAAHTHTTSTNTVTEFTENIKYVLLKSCNSFSTKLIY